MFLCVSDALWGPFTLPLNLAALGAPLCNLLASVELIFPAVTDANGFGKIPLTIPNDKGFLGLSFFNQFGVIDAGANAMGWAFTNGGKAAVGEL